jgi:hypothetical protein
MGLTLCHICTGMGLTPCHICTGTGLNPVPHLRRYWAHPVPHLRRYWAHPVPHLRRDWAHPVSHPLAAAVYNGFEAGLNTNYYAEPAQAPGSSSLFGGSVAVLNVASR